MSEHKRIYLSPPHLGTLERVYVEEAFATNWIAPLGPNVDAFERELAEEVGAGHVAALSSGTHALHLALLMAGVGPGDEVLVSDLTFVASVNPILYLGATPVLIDCELESWNMDPALAAEAIEARVKAGKKPKALVLVHLYGQSADIDPILAACQAHDIPMIEDAAEALGATYKAGKPGAFGVSGVFSFNGNKIITTSGGGALVSDDEALIQRARKLATQARESAAHYEHTEIGFNYRMSNICAGIGRGQLSTLGERVNARRAIFDRYVAGLGDLAGITFAPEAPWGRHSRWLSCMVFDPAAFGCDREVIRQTLEAHNIESRPLWKPMHMQPLYRGAAMVGPGLGARLFERGLCLPSGSSLTTDEQDRVIALVRSCARQ